MHSQLRFATRERLTTILAAASLLAALTTFTLTSRTFLAANKPQLVNVEVQSQVGSPLSIGQIRPFASDPKQPTFGYEVSNLSDKPISAYAIRHDVALGKTQTSGVMLISFWSISSLLYPQAKNVEDFGGTTYGVAVNKITLSVDYVEFADGSTWGPDTFKASQRLAGKRAGGRLSLKNLRDKFKARGVASVLEGIEQELNLAPPPDKSDIWKEGFKEGTNLVRLRIQHAKSKGGLSAVEAELLQPFDVSEGRQQ